VIEEAIGEARDLLGRAEAALDAARAKAPRIVASVADGDIRVLVAERTGDGPRPARHSS
jgi:hypothetical protein